MYYYRKAVVQDGVTKWQTFKLSREEVAAIKKAAIKAGLKDLQLLSDTVKESGAEISPGERLVLLQKVAPTFESFAHDLLEQRLWKDRQSKTSASNGS
jgi:hypothetical protein